MSTVTQIIYTPLVFLFVTMPCVIYVGMRLIDSTFRRQRFAVTNDNG